MLGPQLWTKSERLAVMMDSTWPTRVRRRHAAILITVFYTSIGSLWACAAVAFPIIVRGQPVVAYALVAIFGFSCCGLLIWAAIRAWNVGVLVWPDRLEIRTNFGQRLVPIGEVSRVVVRGRQVLLRIRDHSLIAVPVSPPTLSSASRIEWCRAELENALRATGWTPLEGT